MCRWNKTGAVVFSLPLFFLLQAACESFAKQNNQLVQHLIPVTVPLCPFLCYVLTGKVKHFFQSGVTWEYALCFCDFKNIHLAVYAKWIYSWGFWYDSFPVWILTMAVMEEVPLLMEKDLGLSSVPVCNSDNHMA